MKCKFEFSSSSLCVDMLKKEKKKVTFDTTLSHRINVLYNLLLGINVVYKFPFKNVFYILKIN
jgi:hypothetical protein